MGFMDVFFDALRLNDDDDEFDNEEYDDFEDEEEEEERHFFRRRNREEPEPEAVRTVSRSSRTREDSSARTSSSTQRYSSQPDSVVNRELSEDRPQKSQFRTTTVRKNQGKREDKMEVSVIKPSTVDDEREITETLLSGRAVVINMEGLNVDIAQRIIDFTSGATFAIEGTLQKISNFIFIATPKSVDVSGDLQTIMDSVNASSFTF